MSSHEEYVECLEVLDYKEEVERARISYDKQMARKLNFDTKIESWKFEATKTECSRKSSRSQKSRSSGRSPVSLAVAMKKKQLALAQLIKEQVLREQELKRKMSELQFEKEIMETQMEEEKAAVTLKVYEEVERQGTRSNIIEDYNERLAELVPEDPNMGEIHKVTGSKSNILPAVDPPVDECASVKPPRVIRESTQILPAVESKCHTQEPIKPQKTCLDEHHDQELPQLSLTSPPGQSVTQKQESEKILQELYVRLFLCPRLSTCDLMETQ